MQNKNVLTEHQVKTPSCKSTLVSRNVTICGRRTSVRLEPEMWNGLGEIAEREDCTIHDICSLISLRKNENTSLTAAVRVFVMLYYKAAATEEGHKRARHGSFVNMVRRARVSEDALQFFSKHIRVPCWYGQGGRAANPM